MVLQPLQEVVIVTKPRVVCYLRQWLSGGAKFRDGFSFVYRCHITGKTGGTRFVWCPDCRRRNDRVRAKAGFGALFGDGMIILEMPGLPP